MPIRFKPMPKVMLLKHLTRTALSCCCLAVAVPWAASAQGTYATNGFEYAIAGARLGDQVHPQLSVDESGGYLVWEDNTTDGDGLGISALRLDNGYSGYLSPFRVNSTSAGDQEHAQVALLKGGGAAFVWQGGRFGFQHIYARFLSASNTFLSTDLTVSTPANNFQINPVVATLANSNLVVIWASYNQAGSNSLQDVYGQLLSPAGQKVGGEFLVNQFTTYNQRTPVVAALSGGGFAVAWVSEQQRWGDSIPGGVAPLSAHTHATVDIFARRFSAAGLALGNEFIVNTGSNVCANPTIAAGTDGGFMVGWGERDIVVHDFSWDVYARPFTSAGVGGTVRKVNTEAYGDQVGPRLTANGTDYLMVWTSMGQDGSMEGVYGQFLRGDGTPVGGEFRVNTTTVSRQIHPAVASDGQGRLLAVWSGFVGGGNGFDLYAQRYANVLEPLVAMDAPFVFVPFVTTNGVYQPQLQVSWPVQAGLAIDHFIVYADGAVKASVTNDNVWVMKAADGLTANSTHSFQVAFVTADGRTSPVSLATSATTWMGYSWYGAVPFEWMAAVYGYDTSKWPLPGAQVAPDGPTLVGVFLTGGDPLDPSTWLRSSLKVEHEAGQAYYRLSWNTHAGLTYQVQTSTNMSNWVNYQSPRLAADVVDSTPVPMNSLGYYRVVRLR